MRKRINPRACLASLLLCCLFFICATSSTAQEIDTASTQGRHGAQIFDSYGDVCYEDEQARLDNFAMELMNNPTLKGCLVFYHGVNELPARLHELKADRALDYLVNTRGIDATRLSIVQGGFRAEQTMEMWTVPEGAPAPEPSGTVEYVKPSGHTYQYNETWLDIEYIQIPSDDSADESGDDETEAEATPAPDAEQTEPAEEQAPAFIADEDLTWASEKYAEAVKQEEDARACIIYYADSEQVDLTKIQAVMERGKNILVEQYGLKADSVVVMYGGYRGSATVDTWVVPAKDFLPAPTPEQRPIEEPAVD
ncbi:MAG: hypothetical protein JOZ52_03340, partial [Acidobacteria bacterium]|nr:hypothetical protein [Acidobacteriota bacterium]